MCACRFLLYLVAAATASDGVSASVLWRASALAAYVAGLSYLARGSGGFWPLVLLLVPFVVAPLVHGSVGDSAWSLMALAVWVGWCLCRAWSRSKQGFGGAVAGLLAGIVLVDCLAAAGMGHWLGAAFPGLFLLALLLQRIAPAT